MKKLLFIFLVAALFSGCKDDNFNNRNPYIPNYGFSEEINLNLPAYSQLQYNTNAIYYPAGGARGVIIFNAGGTNNFKAYEAACPNQELAACSTMVINGINAVCPCDDVEYSLFTGLAPGMQYPMKPYRVEVIGTNLIRIYN